MFQWRVGRRGCGHGRLLVGMGPSRRILVADTVLDTHSDDEVEVIVAHELAHHRRGDTWWSAAAAAGPRRWGSTLPRACCPWLAARSPWRGRLTPPRCRSMALVCGRRGGAVAPLVNVVSRAQERRADRDALAWTGNAPALVRTLRRLSAAHLAEDRPPGWAEAFFHRHPAVAERIAAAEAWGAANSQFTIHNSQTAGPRAWSPEPGAYAG